MATANFTTKPPMLDGFDRDIKNIFLRCSIAGMPHRQNAEKPDFQSQRAAQQMRRIDFLNKECPN
jgi:hypothetical protein